MSALLFLAARAGYHVALVHWGVGCSSTPLAAAVAPLRNVTTGALPQFKGLFTCHGQHYALAHPQ